MLVDFFVVMLFNGNIQFFSPQRRDFSKFIGSGDFFCILFCVADKKVRQNLNSLETRD
jgi:hypothetical protein